MGRYSDAKFGVIRRTWFGLTKKHGGEAADGYTFGTTDATKQTHLARYYPRGPIQIHKFGMKVLASITAGSQDTTDNILAELIGRGGSASVQATFSIDIDGGTIAPHVFASVQNLTNKICKAGEYFSITTGTPSTAGGTAANTATTPGTVAFFVDWSPLYDGTKWDV